MRRLLPAAAGALLLSIVTSAAAAPPPVPGGLIGILEPGRYTCETPGEAGEAVRVAATEFDFTVVHGSSYRAGGQRGSYLLTGDTLVMTGGALKGLKLHRISGGFLRRIDASGRDGELRCVRATPGNS